MTHRRKQKKVISKHMIILKSIKQKLNMKGLLKDSSSSLEGTHPNRDHLQKLDEE